MKKLMKGNEAIAEAAVQAGCKFFFGYPITPQNEIPEYMSRRLPEVGGCFLQAESEVAAINMVYGAGGAGARVMTSSSSPGISLKQEGISYIAGAEVPCVIVNIMRGGPGLGGIQPAQSDYYQATRGGGHGDYRMCVLAPSSVQEAVDLTKNAFTIADRYRSPVLVLGDGMIGQMMEPVDMEKEAPSADGLPEKTWAADGHVPTPDRPRSIINSLFIDPKVLEQHCLRLEAKYRTIAENECRWQEEMLDDAEVVLVAYGTTSRICRSAMRKCREAGLKVGMLRPITLWPFPDQAIRATLPTAKHYLAVEMSTGQMVDDVRLAVNGERPVHFFGRTGGMVPSVSEVVAEIKKYASQDSGTCFDLDHVIDDMQEKLKTATAEMKRALHNAGKQLDTGAAAGLKNTLNSAADTVKQSIKGAGKVFDESSFDEIEAKFKTALDKMKQKLKDAGDRIDDTSSDEMVRKVKDAANAMAARMKEAAGKMGDQLNKAGSEADSSPLNEIEEELDKASQELDKAFETAADSVDQAAEETAEAVETPETAEEEAEQPEAEDAETDELTLEEVGKKLEAAAKLVEEKLNEAGKKIDEILNSPKAQKKTEDAGRQINEFFDRTGKSVAGGFESFMKIVTHAAETVKNDLKDIEKSKDSQDKEDK